MTDLQRHYRQRCIARTTAQWLALYRQRDRVAGNISETQWRVMLDLFENGPARVTSVTATCGAPFATAHRHIANLEATGLIASAGSEDRRTRILSLTESGNAILHAINTPAALPPTPCGRRGEGLPFGNSAGGSPAFDQSPFHEAHNGR